MLNKMRFSVVFFVLVLQAPFVISQEKSCFALGVGVGTTGPSLSATYQINNYLNVRGIYANYDFDEQEVESGINYNIDIELDTFSLLLDYHPFTSSGFRLSVGAVKNGTEFRASSTQTTGTFRVGGTDFNAADVGTLNASVSYDDIAPYLGIGWGNAVMNNKNLTFSLDLGVIGMDQPDVRLSSTGTNPAIQANLDAELINEERELESSLDDFDLFPVINLSLNYQF